MLDLCPPPCACCRPARTSLAGDRLALTGQPQGWADAARRGGCRQLILELCGPPTSYVGYAAAAQATSLRSERVLLRLF